MKLINNEIYIQRGESFTIDRTIVNRDGSPYIISSELKNPYFLITVSTNKREQLDREVYNYWLDLSKFPRFEHTQIQQLELSGDTEWPEPDDSFLNAVYTDKHKEQYKYYSDGEWKDYRCRIIKLFNTNDTMKWVSQEYVYSISLVSGTKSLNGDRPLSEYDNVQIILPPTKLIVKSNIKGGYV